MGATGGSLKTAEVWHVQLTGNGSLLDLVECRISKNGVPVLRGEVQADTWWIKTDADGDGDTLQLGEPMETTVDMHAPQPSLFDEQREAARKSDPATSRASGAAIRPKAGSKRGKAFTVYCESYPEPRSLEDVYTRWPEEREDSIRPRVAELKKMGLIQSVDTVVGSHGAHIERCGLTLRGLHWAQQWKYRSLK